MTKWVTVLVSSVLCVGCSALGPRTLSSGRSVYNEVLNRTANEQILQMIVRMRYGETFGFLQVASVTAYAGAGRHAG